MKPKTRKEKPPADHNLWGDRTGKKGTPPRKDRWPPKSPIKFALMAPGLTKAEAEALRKRYKRHGVRYTQVKKSPYGGYDLRVGVRPLGPGGQGGLQIILTENMKMEMEKW